MKKLIIFFVVVAFGVITIASCKKKAEETTPTVLHFGTWNLKSSSQVSKRVNHVGVAVNGKGYIGLGQQYASTVIYLHDWWEFNPLTGTWTQKVNFTGNSDGTQKAFATHANAYVVDSNHIYSYSPSGNTWSKLNDFAGVRRTNYLLLGTDSGAFLGLGTPDTFPFTPLHDWWKYNESTDQWTQKSNFPGVGTSNSASFLLNNSIYVGLGGYTQSSTGYTDYKLWSYSLSTDQWNNVSTAPEYSGGSPYGFALSGKGFFVGGVLPVVDKSLSAYDPGSNSWQSYYDVKCSPQGAMFVINNKLYLFQSWNKYIGDNSSPDDKFWELTP